MFHPFAKLALFYVLNVTDNSFFYPMLRIHSVKIKFVKIRTFSAENLGDLTFQAGLDKNLTSLDILRWSYPGGLIKIIYSRI